MTPPDFTDLLQAAANGDSAAADQLLPVVYDELRSLARHHLRGEAATIEPTALVHEAWLRIAGEHEASWNHRGHFFGAASQAMRRVLVDHARQRNATKRRTPGDRTTLSDVSGAQVDLGNVLDVHEALSQLEAERPREGRIVLLRYFGGLEVKEIAAILDVSVGTVERDWRLSRARLQRWLDESRASEP